MLDIFHQLTQWIQQERNFVLATVTQTWGSAPRKVGAVMAIDEHLHILGSVSGGCIEGEVLRASQAVLASGQGKALHFGVSNEEAWSVGLSCGGKVSVWLAPFLRHAKVDQTQDLWQALNTRVEAQQAAVLLSTMEEGQVPQFALWLPEGQALGASLPHELAEQAYQQRKSQVLEAEGKSYFAQVFPKKDTLMLIGAAHIAVDLIALAAQFGFESIVIDPRRIFTEKLEFTAQPDQLLTDWPAEILPKLDLDAFTYAVTLTHDPKIDDQALQLLLRSEIAYIGALGSRRTHAKRVARLQEAGFSDAEISRIQGPVGLDIGAQTAQEIALSILAQVIQVKNGAK